MLATKSNSYTFQKDGIWYFSRRVPADLRRHYRTGRIAYSLRTKSVRDARVRAMSDAAKLKPLHQAKIQAPMVRRALKLNPCINRASRLEFCINTAAAI
jgi:hypothetical protein